MKILDKTTLLEEYYKAVSESLEWGDDCEDNSYYNYINGLSDMIGILLKKVDEKSLIKSE